jgi:hypothetical protein
MNKLLAKMLGAHDQNSGGVFGVLLFLVMFLVPTAQPVGSGRHAPLVSAVHAARESM